MKKKIVAMLLAGGQGSRLGILTSSMAKPAVPFGGKYRIIDFPLSNCVNSDIDTVGVLTQYRPLALNAYLGTGQHWDLDRNDGGVFVLPPYMTEKDGRWYSGTANAIWQNREFIDQYDTEYVLILSGDHIYKMDYSKMLEFHKEKKAACTVATITVPIEEASRFGICNTREDGSIYEFEEKPKEPKNNQASMGIYVFSTNVLLEYLELDEKDPKSSKDFGKNVIPNLLKSGERLYAYPFSGYWRDVGTIGSLWEANMDLLEEKPELDLRTRFFRIYSRNSARPPQFIGKTASISSSMISEGCTVYGTVKHSVLSGGAVIGRDAVVCDSVIMDDVVIEPGAEVYYAIVDSETVIRAGVRVGSPDAGKDKITVIAKGSDVSKNVEGK